jgi:hypothetical protein
MLPLRDAYISHKRQKLPARRVVKSAHATAFIKAEHPFAGKISSDEYFELSETAH